MWDLDDRALFVTSRPWFKTRGINSDGDTLMIGVTRRCTLDASVIRDNTDTRQIVIKDNTDTRQI